MMSNKLKEFRPRIEGDEVYEYDLTHYSSLPWFNFTGLTHLRNFGDGDSIPKISFGKIFMREGRSYLPFSIHVHHALVDGFHVARFVDLFNENLNN